MKYTVKIWLFTVLVSPLLIGLILGIILNYSDVKEILSSFDIFWVMMLVGLISSIPAMIIFYILLILIKKLEILVIKILLSFYSFISVWMTFYLFDTGFMTDWTGQTLWVLIYSLTIVLGVWIFKISNPKKTLHNTV